MEQTIDVVNASDFFSAIKLGDVESEMFLDTVGFKYELNGLILTGGSVFIWCLQKFIAECEDIYEKDVMMEKLRDYNLSVNDHVRYINIQA